MKTDDTIGDEYLCIQCGKPGQHTISKHWEQPSDKHFCCGCYVRNGNSPADWHEDCMKTFNEMAN